MPVSGILITVYGILNITDLCARMRRGYLYSHDWFSDDLRNLGDNKIYEPLRGHWIIEMPEMIATISARNNEDIKSFLTRQKDTYRDPYAKYEEDRKRQCVFARSTNTRQFIPFDRTGARSCVGVCKTGTTLIRVSTVMGTLYCGLLTTRKL